VAVDVPVGEVVEDVTGATLEAVSKLTGSPKKTK
jgi:hypothetical protein